MRVTSVRARAICSATESEEKVMKAVSNVLGIEVSGRAKWFKTAGIFNEPLSVLEVEVTGDDAVAVADRLLSVLTEEELEERTERGSLKMPVVLNHLALPETSIPRTLLTAFMTFSSDSVAEQMALALTEVTLNQYHLSFSPSRYAPAFVPRWRRAVTMNSSSVTASDHSLGPKRDQVRRRAVARKPTWSTTGSGPPLAMPILLLAKEPRTSPSIAPEESARARGPT